MTGDSTEPERIGRGHHRLDRSSLRGAHWLFLVVPTLAHQVFVPPLRGALQGWVSLALLLLAATGFAAFLHARQSSWRLARAGAFGAGGAFFLLTFARASLPNSVLLDQVWWLALICSWGFIFHYLRLAIPWWRTAIASWRT
jgi:hypothetical protein